MAFQNNFSQEIGFDLPCKGDHLHVSSKLIFWEKRKTYSVCPRVIKVNDFTSKTIEAVFTKLGSNVLLMLLCLIYVFIPVT